MARKVPHKRVWIVLGWNLTDRGRALFSSTGEQRWHWTYKSAMCERITARKRFPGTTWSIVRMVPR